jgi:rubredoxin
MTEVPRSSAKDPDASGGEDESPPRDKLQSSSNTTLRGLLNETLTSLTRNIPLKYRTPSKHEIPAFTSLLKTQDHGWLCPQCKVVDNNNDGRRCLKFDTKYDLGYVIINGRGDFLLWAYENNYKGEETIKDIEEAYKDMNAEEVYKKVSKDFAETYKDAAGERRVAYFVNPAFAFKCLNQRCIAFDRRDIDSTHPRVAHEFRPKKLDDPQYRGDEAEKLERRLRQITRGKWPCPKCCISQSNLEKIKENNEFREYVKRVEKAIFWKSMVSEKVGWHPHYHVYIWWNKWSRNHGACTNKATESGDPCGLVWGADFMALRATKSVTGNSSATYWELLLGPFMGRPQSSEHE